MPNTLDNPYAEKSGTPYVWMRGNLHCHSTRSDGKREAQAVIDAYAKLGHDFFALSDHDILSDYKGLDARGLILIPANEVSRGGPHILHVGAQELIEPRGDRQAVIDAINSSGGFAILNHADWEEHFNHYSFEDLQRYQRYTGMEIYNGSILEDPGSPYSVDKWDRLLGDDRLLWGYATDDSHNTHHDGRGCCVVRVPKGTRDPAVIVEALRNGNFYASTGVEIAQIQVTGSKLSIEAPNAHLIELVGAFGARLQWTEGTRAEFDVGAIASPYVRLECTGAKGTKAWTQPFRMRGEVLDRLRSLAAHRPALKVSRLSGAIDLSLPQPDPQWNQAPESAQFYLAGTAGTPSVQTRVQACCNATHLFVRVRCAEPKMEQVKFDRVNDGGSVNWGADSAELFLDVEGKGERYYHLLANPAGDLTWTGMRGLKGRVEAQVRARRDSAEWTVEFAIALEPMGASAAPGKKWGFHVCRNRPIAKETSFWAWVGRTNHAPQRFGTLEFA